VNILAFGKLRKPLTGQPKRYVLYSLSISSNYQATQMYITEDEVK